MTQSNTRRITSRIQGFLLAASSMLAIATASAAGLQLTLPSRPLYAGGNIPPLVMIDLTKDHTLHQKAYNDYSDLDGDGILDSTYKNDIEYAGYFDSYKCYDYDKDTIQGFVPKSVTTTRYCDGKTWAGNFLNWATMSRIDEVRKILYGGTRSTDKATTTVLERAFLPMDAHAWAKFYNGSDASKLVPFAVEDAATITALTSSAKMKLTGAVVNSVALSDVGNVQIGDQLKFEPSSGATAGSSMTGWVMKVNTSSVNMAFYPDSVFNPGNSNTEFSSWKVTNLTRGGLTICNVTPKDSSNLNSQTNKQAPQIRVVKGNYATWGASEQWQCNWYDERSNTQGSFLPQIGDSKVSGSSNGNRAALSGINSSAENPSRTARGVGAGQDTGVFNARVQVCVPNLINTEKCQQYPNGSYKPYGLLQKYGETGQMLFGLMTGSYDKNISGGVLRQNVTNFSSEIDTDTGIFKYSATTNPVKGIVWNIDKLRPYGYSYSDGGYTSADQCNYQQTGIQASGGSNAQGKPANEGNCSTWGNPISEIYVETLRYFAGKKANSAFLPPSDSGKDYTLGLTQATWANPMDLPKSNPNRAPYCSPMNALLFNASVSSYDNDQLAGLAEIGSKPDITERTNFVGTKEGVNDKKWFTGSVSGVTDDNDNQCSAKTVKAFADVLGICPEGPSQKGTFQIAGAALFAKTNRLRTDSEAAALGMPSGDKNSFKLSTYAVQLATTTPKITVNVNGKAVTIMPAYQLHPTNVNPSSGTLVDFKVISQTSTSGKFYVNWEDSIAGGDYDQDVWGTLSYTISGDNITVSTRVVSASTSNGQGFGYSISGTSKDGTHFHSGIKGFNYTDSVPVVVTPKTRANDSGGCSGCELGDAETSVTYTANGQAGSQFLDPLFYAAKWGNFKDSNGDGTPDLTSEWDVQLANGKAGSDGLPDSYFYATNPGALSAALERAFLSILKISSASALAVDSGAAKAATATYQARFNATDWSGQLLAFAISPLTGKNLQPEVWDAGVKMKTVDPDARKILTFNTADNTSAGIPFRWDRLPTSYQTALNASDTQGSKRLNWLRGDATNEGDGGLFRERTTSVLGDIINSGPAYVGPPSAGRGEASYADFAVAKLNRKPMIYVGANDGMLHAFSADPSKNGDGGKELFAYVPSPLYSKLANLTDKNYVHSYYVDGSPIVGDAFVNSAWKTVLVGGLAGGGKGVYALDVTDPESITEATAATTAMWEFTAANDVDLGYVYGRPNIVRLGNGKWAAIFGNGVNSTAARGSVFVLFLDRDPGSKKWTVGTDYLKLTVDDATATKSNGIVQVSAVDVNGDGTQDYLYAGDLLGNVWRFTVGTDNAANYQGTRKLVFKATDASGNAQPITGGFSAMRHPLGGILLAFGTGRYLDVSDPSNMAVQSVYGIWDRLIAGQDTVARSALVPQTLTAITTGTTNSFVGGSQNAVKYQPYSVMGWYFDLKTTGSTGVGERVVYDPSIEGGALRVTTLIPSQEVCANGGSSRTYNVDALTGGSFSYPVFDTNGDGKIDGSDASGVSAIEFNNGLNSQGTYYNTGGYTHLVLSNTGGGFDEALLKSGSPSGRVSWRQILAK